MKWNRWIMLVAALVAAQLGGFVAWSAEKADLQIHVFNVGQTDSQLIVGPDKALLIDVGAENAGPKGQFRYVAEKIRSLWPDRKVDYLLVTHYHGDHMGTRYPNSTKGNGIWGLLDEEDVQVDTVIDRGDVTKFGEETKPHGYYQSDIKRWLSEHKVGKRVTAHLGSDQIRLGGNVTVDIVTVGGNDVLQKKASQDPSRFEDYPASENDYSIAIKVTLGKFEYFTAGDLSGVDTTQDYGEDNSSSYNDIETSIADTVGNIEVLRVNHHGSSHSSNPYFVSRLLPEWSIISCGKNSYGHPSRDVFERLRDVSKRVDNDRRFPEGVGYGHRDPREHLQR